MFLKILKVSKLLKLTLSMCLMISLIVMAGLVSAEDLGSNGAEPGLTRGVTYEKTSDASDFSVTLGVQRGDNANTLQLTADSSVNDILFRFDVREMGSEGQYTMIRGYSLEKEFSWGDAEEGKIYEIVVHGVSEQEAYDGYYVVFGNTDPSAVVPFKGINMQVKSEGNKVQVTAVPQGGTNVIYALQFRKVGGQYNPLDLSNPYQASPNFVKELAYGDYEIAVHAIDMAAGAMTYYGVYTTFTHPPNNLIVRPSTVTVEQAQRWAAARGAHQRFIDIAPVYWEYGELTGINPEILYCQSAKETAFGRYTGIVAPEQNNWAGIKTATATGDEPCDHDSFSTPEDGVRAHFNHISAYVGKEPIGEPHGRYFVVLKIDWAGTIRTVEELGARWAPASDYGTSIMNHYLADLLRY